MICYNKLLKIFDERKITSYTIRKDKVIGQASWKKIHEGGHVDTRTLDALCKYLNCQPGDIIEYIPDEEQTDIGVHKTIEPDKKSQNHDS